MLQVTSRYVYTIPKHGQQEQEAQSTMIWTSFVFGSQELSVLKYLIFASTGVVGRLFQKGVLKIFDKELFKTELYCI